jgi:putative transcriptional regulator
MKDAAFREIVASVRQAGRIRRGTLRASRTRVFRPADIKAVRAKLGASQSEFALMIGVSVATLRNWEQGRRTPDGPALALLRARRRILKPLRTRYMENVERHNRRCTRRRAALARHAVPSRCARSVRVSANPLRRLCDSRHACSGTARS